MEDYAKWFIAKAQPDDTEDGNAEGRYIIHMPYGSPHMAVYNRFWAWMNANQNLLVLEKSHDDFPRSYLMFTPEGERILLVEFEGYVN